MTRYRPSFRVERAVECLAKIIEERRDAGSHFLPALTDLSRRTGYCRMTVAKAVRQLCDQGVLTAQPRRGIHINAGVTVTKQPGPVVHHVHHQPAVPRWQGIRDALIEDFTSGRYAPGARLPAAKQFRREYGAAHAAIAAALSILAENGWIVRSGRSYRRTLAAAGAGGASVAVIAATFAEGWHRRSTPRSAELWLCLEQECVRRRLRLEIVTAQQAADNAAKKNPAALQRAGLIGAVVLPLTVPHPVLSSVLASLGRSGLPAAVLDESGVMTGESRLHSPLARIFTMATTPNCGHAAGKYLAGLGHRHVVFVCMDPGASVVRTRCDGLAEAFAGAGISGAVALRSPEPAFETETVLNGMREYSRFRDVVRRASEGIMRQISGGRPKPSVDLFTWEIARREVEARALRPVFARLVSEGHTAWVCFNDDIAFMALEYLARAGRRVPEDISVLGFDDTLEAFGCGLTSYNFNVAGTTAAMMDHLLRPAAAGRARRSQCVEIPGVVMERGSTGPTGLA